MNARESIRASQQRTVPLSSALANESPDALAGRGLDARALAWNRAAERVSGFGCDEARSKAASELLPLKVLVVEDSERDVELLLRALRRGGYAVTHERVETGSSLIAALERQVWDLVLSDLTLPALSASAALGIVRERYVDLPFIIVSGGRGEEAAVEAMRSGAQDFVTKSNLSRLLPAIARELREAETRKSNRRLEERLRQAQKMEAIGRLSGGIAHDFNNLLSVIVGYTDLLVTQVPTENPIHGDLEEVKSAANRAATLTRQLLAFSRQQVQEPKILDLNQVTSGMERMLRRLLSEDVELTLQSATGLGSIRADRGQIEQVIMNLVINASDAMEAGGALTIETAGVELGWDQAKQRIDVQPGSYVMLSVRDTGVGMDRATLARVFEPFFTTKPSDKGTGLGLSTVFGIVHRSGGHIVIESELGLGTRFDVYLPQIDGAPDAAHSSRPPPPSLSGLETVLLVEDEEQVRGVLKAILTRNGYRVLEAHDGAHALFVSEAHEGTIDLLLSDVKMPRMSGLELARLLSITRPGMQTLYVSGYAESAELPRSQARSVVVLPKPINAESLLRKVRKVLDRRANVDKRAGS